MRITGGSHKGRQFHIPDHLGIRPTTDFAKEALFNILRSRINFEEKKALDLFGGSGNISYEFASQGCSQIITVEKNFKVYRFIKKTVTELNLTNIKVIKADVFTFLKICPDSFDIIFADPPFKLKNIHRIPLLVFEKNLLNPNGILIVEHSSEVKFSEIRQLKETRKYGTVNFSIFGNT